MEELTVGTILPIWWAFTWRMLLFGFIGGFIAGFIVGFALGFAGLPQYVAIASGAAGYLVGIPLSMYVMLIALTRNYKQLKIERRL